MSTTERRAVFLSYASQDAEAARKIAEALRAAGVEVWFDQNELVGGDAWDAKIRKQIRECALFIPIISANTQARLEGYFRIEWKLAAQRTHAMAAARAFLLPVVIDATSDTAAHVPEEFVSVQWTRLRDGESPEKFCTRVKALIGAEHADAAHREASEWSTVSGRGAKAPPLVRSRLKGLALAALGVAAACLLAWPWLPWREPGSFGSRASPERPAGAVSPLTLSPPVAGDEKSLIVLPLENLSPDPENAFFTDGMHAEIISALQSVPELSVKSREMALVLQRQGGSIAEIGRQAGVAYTLAGSVRREGTKVRVLLELRRVSDDALVWSAPKVTRELKDALGLQAEVAEEVARVLRARFDKGAFAGLRFLATDPRAFDAYLKAHAEYQRGLNNARHILAAAALMEEGMKLDPHYMPGARLLGRMYVRAFSMQTELGTLAVQAKEWSELAARLTPGGAGDSALAYYYIVVECDPARALIHAENAVRALPNDCEGHNALGLALRELGRLADALPHFERSIALDPLNSPSWMPLIDAFARLRRPAQSRMWLERFQEVLPEKAKLSNLTALQFCLDGSLPETIAAEPTNFARLQWLWRTRRFPELAEFADLRRPPGYRATDYDLRHRLSRCDALRRIGREAEAAAVAQQVGSMVEQLNAVAEFQPWTKPARSALALSRLGDGEAALASARRAVELYPQSAIQQRWSAEIALAQLCAYLNRPRDCCVLLARLLRVPSGLTVPMLRVDPTWDPVRDDPEFQALLVDPRNSVPL